MCPIFVNFSSLIDMGKDEVVRGVTKLQSEIYVLCISLSTHVIRVFEDRKPFRLKRIIEIKEIKYPRDIGSSENENCLYVCDQREQCIWKITRERDDQHNIFKWLVIYFQPMALSVSNDGHLCLINASILWIYGSEAELLRSIQLPRDVKNPTHAVETSTGNFIIIHEWKKGKEHSTSSGRESEKKWVVSEVSKDGGMVIRRFIPSNEIQKLNDPQYLSLDSDDRVFVADYWNERVILLDSDLKWNRIICPTNELVENRIPSAFRLFYDKEQRQLIVGGYLYLGKQLNVYTLSRK